MPQASAISLSDVRVPDDAISEAAVSRISVRRAESTDTTSVWGGSTCRGVIAPNDCCIVDASVSISNNTSPLNQRSVPNTVLLTGMPESVAGRERGQVIHSAATDGPPLSWSGTRSGGVSTMSKNTFRVMAVLLSLTLVAAACAGDDSAGKESGTTAKHARTTIDYAALGLWNDGACDPSKPKLKVGLMTVFASPVISLESHAKALKASAEAFNKRGGANGSCIEVHACDDGADADQSISCVREIDQAGVRRDRERPRHRRPGRSVGGHGQSGDPPHRFQRLQRGLGRPERLSARRLRNRIHLPDAEGAHRRGRDQDRHHPGRPGRRLGAEGASRGHLRGGGDVPRRRPRSGGYHRLHAVHPQGRGSRRRRHRARPR